MLTERAFRILRVLRKNARIHYTEMSKETGIPTSTAYDNCKMLERYIVRHSPLIAFDMLGYPLRIRYLAAADDRATAVHWLSRHESTNNLHLVNHNQTYSEHLFQNAQEEKRFREQLRKRGRVALVVQIEKELEHEIFVPTYPQVA